eukprot:3410546-Pyramimonas_sp.AAC.1
MEKWELQTWAVRATEVSEDIEEEVSKAGEEGDEDIAPALGRPGILELTAGVARVTPTLRASTSSRRVSSSFVVV